MRDFWVELLEQEGVRVKELEDKEEEGRGGGTVGEGGLSALWLPWKKTMVAQESFLVSFSSSSTSTLKALVVTPTDLSPSGSSRENSPGEGGDGMDARRWFLFM